MWNVGRDIRIRVQRVLHDEIRWHGSRSFDLPGDHFRIRWRINVQAESRRGSCHELCPSGLRKRGSMSVYLLDDDAGIRASMSWAFESTGLDLRTYRSVDQLMAD